MIKPLQSLPLALGIGIAGSVNATVMSRISRFAAALASVLVVVAFAPVSRADTIDISLPDTDLTTNFSITNSDFTLPAGFSNASLNFDQLFFDDRGVVRLNGVIVASAGLGFSGDGTIPEMGMMVLSLGGPNLPFLFTSSSLGAPPSPVLGPFVAGLNILELIGNDTNNGIQGDLNTCCAVFSSLKLTANVTFAPVPLPAALPLFASAFGGLGFFGWVRRRRAAATA